MKSPIDFTLLCDKTEGYAVHCQTKEEAEEFVECCKTLFPHMTDNWGKSERCNFDVYKEETAYSFDKKTNGEWRKFKLRYGSANTMAGMGFKIIEFAEIYYPIDLEESDKSIDFLLS